MCALRANYFAPVSSATFRIGLSDIKDVTSGESRGIAAKETRSMANLCARVVASTNYKSGSKNDQDLTYSKIIDGYESP